MASGSPQRSRKRSIPAAPPSSATSWSVRVSCQLIALCAGSPVSRSHSSVVSRWLAIPIAITSRKDSCALSSASVTTVTTLAQISRGLCSTQPGRGKMCSCSFWLTETMRPTRSNTMQREDAVPWSIDAR